MHILSVVFIRRNPRTVVKSIAGVRTQVGKNKQGQCIMRETRKHKPGSQPGSIIQMHDTIQRL